MVNGVEKKSKLVTIGIPFYKDVDTLAMAIKSVFAQSWNNFELILIDDGGNDGSLEIAKQFINDKRVILISDGKNKGLPRRLNQLIDIANGEYFARMDADDVMHPRRIEKQVEYLEANNDVDVLGTGAFSMSIYNRVLGEKIPKPQEFTINDLFKQTVVMHPTVMARTGWYKKNRYSENAMAVRAEDFELWCRTWPYSKFCNLPDKLMFYREGNSLKKSLNNQIMTYDNTINIIKKYAVNKISSYDIIKLILKIKIKKYIYIILKKINMQGWLGDWILSKRYLPLSESELRYGQKIIDDIMEK